MAREEVAPAELDLESIGRRDYWVVLPPTSTSVPYLIPLTVIVGPEAEPGKGLAAFGGNHGNEYEGPMAIKHILREISTLDVAGRIILVPVLNVAAFAVGTRESTADDGLKLNRLFVTGAAEPPAPASITHRIVSFVRDCIWPHVHMVIDVHSGGEVARMALSVSFTPRRDDPELTDAREQIARWFGAPIVIRRKGVIQQSGLLIDDAERLGKMAFGSELGWGAAANARGVRFARHGILAAAIHHDQLRGEIEPIAHHADGTAASGGGQEREQQRVGAVSRALRTTGRVRRTRGAGADGGLPARLPPCRRRAARPGDRGGRLCHIPGLGRARRAGSVPVERGPGGRI